MLEKLYWREESIKTRIETPIEASTEKEFNRIEEKNPLKQGLKPDKKIMLIPILLHWREESIKTRIETKFSKAGYRHNLNWREESIKTRIETQKWIPTHANMTRIEEKNPLKQGLKLSAMTSDNVGMFYWREESIKTRIETWICSNWAKWQQILKRRIH